jgi:hypothetical protein
VEGILYGGKKNLQHTHTINSVTRLHVKTQNLYIRKCSSIPGVLETFLWPLRIDCTCHSPFFGLEDDGTMVVFFLEVRISQF